MTIKFIKKIEKSTLMITVFAINNYFFVHHNKNYKNYDACYIRKLFLEQLVH